VARKCNQCGKCCLEVGQTFWRNSEHPLIKKIADTCVSNDGGLPCDMLVKEKGKYVCLIWKYIGKKGLPEACRDYPFDGDKCFGGLK
jgi:hypothetical protein